MRFFTNPQGGILDDLMIANLAITSSCGQCRAARMPTRRTCAAPCRGAATSSAWTIVRCSHSRAARRSPCWHGCRRAAAMRFMEVRRLRFSGADCVVSRSGYTGEDGFEISVPASQAETFARKLLENPRWPRSGSALATACAWKPGLCLYGSDLDPRTTPVEASLEWAIPEEPAHRRRARRRLPRERHDPAAARNRRRAQARRAALAGAHAGAWWQRSFIPSRREPVGQVTSGGFGPSVDAPVAMGYVARCRGQRRAPRFRRRARQARAGRGVQLPFIKPRLQALTEQTGDCGC